MHRDMGRKEEKEYSSKCLGGRVSTQVCINNNCEAESTFLCGDYEGCQHCKQHIFCFCQSIKKIVAHIQSNVSSRKSHHSLTLIQGELDSMISKIETVKKELVFENEMSLYTELERQFLKKVGYLKISPIDGESVNKFSIRGKEASNLLNQESKPHYIAFEAERAARVLEKLRKISSNIDQEIRNLLKSLMHHLPPKSPAQKSPPPLPIKPQNSPYNTKPQNLPHTIKPQNPPQSIKPQIPSHPNPLPRTDPGEFLSSQNQQNLILTQPQPDQKGPFLPADPSPPPLPPLPPLPLNEEERLHQPQSPRYNQPDQLSFDGMILSKTIKLEDQELSLSPNNPLAIQSSQITPTFPALQQPQNSANISITPSQPFPQDLLESRQRLEKKNGTESKDSEIPKQILHSQTYQGEYDAAGIPHGEGVIIYSNGKKFVGTFQHGKKQSGTLFNKGVIQFEGVFRNDLPFDGYQFIEGPYNNKIVYFWTNGEKTEIR